MKFEILYPNYCATVVKLEQFQELAGCDNIKHARIFSNSVIVSKDTKFGDIGLFFPVESELSHEFIKFNNLYRDSSLNTNPEKKGFWIVRLFRAAG